MKKVLRQIRRAEWRRIPKAERPTWVQFNNNYSK